MWVTFSQPVALQVGTQAPGLKLGANLYAPSTTVKSAGTVLSLSSWLGQGKDVGSFEAAPELPADGFTPGRNAVDRGRDLGLPFCGAAPDVGAVESGC